jgi:hypothetical protein
MLKFLSKVNILRKGNLRTGMVAQACNLSYSRGRSQKDHSWRPAQVKSYQDSISTNKPGVMVHA